MKVVAFNGSVRKNGNTAILIRYVFEELEKEGIKTELVELAGKRVHGCAACMKCFKNKDQQCSFDDDIVNECIEKMIEADGIIIGSPVYFADLTSETKSLIDRAGMVGRANGHCYSRKVGAAVVAGRRAGTVHTFDSINHFFLISQMIVPGSSYWNIGFGREKGEVEQDEEGHRTMTDLGRNMAWLMKKIGER
ncbi:Iron-sulfur flavoprotein [hydrothermal vent metagenome]|uniref:Iron-sulfur flavoprotein n=1 Tax=hydrothermal vent metagenome TaxID=652676 RepID=A0A3B1BZS3_9ZZZZ